MNAIEYFQQKRAALRAAESWRALIGKRYSGGGGGTGNVCNATVTLTIYHQEYDGATNYHEAPHELLGFVEMIVLQRDVALIDAALAAMREDVRVAAEKASAEAHEVLTVASSPVPEGGNDGR